MDGWMDEWMDGWMDGWMSTEGGGLFFLVVGHELVDGALDAGGRL